MSAEKIKVVFYHSVICPRCHFSGLMLRNVLRKHPDIEVTRVEFLTSGDQARNDGIKSIPALAAQGRSLSGVVLTPGKIDRFLESLTAAST